MAGLAAAAIVSAVIPAAAGLAFLISLAARRPLIAVAAHRWPWLTGHRTPPRPSRAVVALAAEAILAAITIAWLHRSPAPEPQTRAKETV